MTTCRKEFCPFDWWCRSLLQVVSWAQPRQSFFCPQITIAHIRPSAPLINHLWFPATHSDTRLRVWTHIVRMCVSRAAKWREHSLLSIWQLKTSHSKRPAQIVPSSSPRKPREVVGDKGVSAEGRACECRGGVRFLSNEAVRHVACGQKARMSVPPARPPEPAVWKLNGPRCLQLWISRSGSLRIFQFNWIQFFISRTLSAAPQPANVLAPPRCNLPFNPGLLLISPLIGKNWTNIVF